MAGMKGANVERDRDIFLRRSRGEPIADLAARYGVSAKRIEQIITKERGKLPRITAEDYRQDFAAELDAMRQVLRDIVDAGPVAAFSSKGEQLWASDNPDGSGVLKPVFDHSAQLAAIDRIVAVQARAAKLLGLDSPEKLQAESTVRYVVDGAEDV